MFLMLLAIPTLISVVNSPVAEGRNTPNRRLIFRRLLTAGMAAGAAAILDVITFIPIISMLTPDAYQIHQQADQQGFINAPTHGPATALRMAQLLSLDAGTSLIATAVTMWTVTNEENLKPFRDLVRSTWLPAVLTAATAIGWCYAVSAHPHAVAELSNALMAGAAILNCLVARHCIRVMQDDQDPEGNQPAPIPPRVLERIRKGQERKQHRQTDKAAGRNAPNPQPQRA